MIGLFLSYFMYLARNQYNNAVLLRAVDISEITDCLFRLHNVIGRWQGGIHYPVPLPAFQREEGQSRGLPIPY